MLKSEVFRNRRLVKARRRSKRIKKQTNYRNKTYRGTDKVTLQELTMKDLEKRRKKEKRIKKRKEKSNGRRESKESCD